MSTLKTLDSRFEINTLQQKGSVLLEGLIAILIFSMGILAIVGMQAGAIKTVSDSQYRTEASFLASRIISEVWASNPLNLATFSSSPQFNAWKTEVQNRLPSANTFPPTLTLVGDTNNGFVATVTVNWRAPGDSDSHKYVAVTEVHR